MLRAVRAGAKTIYIGLGGSATNDGGAGMLQALGARVVDDQGCDIAPGLAGLERVASVDLAPALQALDGARIVVLSDVENPLVGRRGALAVFGGQKGLPTGDAEALSRCDSWMVGYGRLLDTAIVEARAQGLLRTPEGARTFGSVLGVPGAGAAGGLGAALLALGAELHSGVETVLDLVGFDEHVRDVDLVITGEGNMDEQSAAGKAPVGVARRAKRYGKPVAAVVGGRADNWMRCTSRASTLYCRSVASPWTWSGHSIRKKPQPTLSAPASQPHKPMTSLASKAYLPISCGGIRSVFAFKGPIQSVFHRNLRMAIRGWLPWVLGRTVCHEMRPSTTLSRPPSTIPEFAKTKPQVESLPIFEKVGYGRPLRPKRSRWALFVAQHQISLFRTGPP